MTRGLVIGKFMPIHQGHVALINFAASHVDELIVSMSYTAQDPIPHDLRFSWITDIFKSDSMIRPYMVIDDFDNELLPWDQRTVIWADFLRRHYPTVDYIISSEDYGAPVAEQLGAKHILFDRDRLTVPVSATLIRKQPMVYWEYIPAVARAFFVKKICIYGPESTGKSTITKYLAEYYHTEYVPEVARELITSNDFTAEDIIRIGLAHHDRIQQKAAIANKLLFCDTDVITTQLYSFHYLKTIPEILFELERRTQYTAYFLLDIDVEWVPDGLRDLGEQRQAMMDLFKDALDQRNIPYFMIRGSYGDREKQICAIVDQLLFSGS